MPSQENHALDDRLLTRYLLGALPDEEAERLNELSITDDEFAGRVDALENELVDAYVRGELSGDDLKRFQNFYLASPKRGQKVEFADGLLALERRTAAAAAEAKTDKKFRTSEVKEKSPRFWRMVLFPRFAFQAALMAASLLMLVLSASVLFQNSQLRRQISAASAQRSLGDQRAEELEKQLAQERAAKADALNQLERARESRGNLDGLKTLAVLLPPPIRGAGQIPTISLRSSTHLVVLVLPLEAADFAAYRAKLRDPGTNRTLWRSESLTAASAGERKTVSISFRAGLLKQQNYVIDLAGVSNRDAAEVIGSYPFRVVLQ